MFQSSSWCFWNLSWFEVYYDFIEPLWGLNLVHSRQWYIPRLLAYRFDVCGKWTKLLKAPGSASKHKMVLLKSTLCQIYMDVSKMWINLAHTQWKFVEVIGDLIYQSNLTEPACTFKAQAGAYWLVLFVHLLLPPKLFATLVYKCTNNYQSHVMVSLRWKFKTATESKWNE